MKTLTVVLFAGGESRRMGADKATLEIDGEPLWSRQLRTLRHLRPQVVLISARTKPAWCPPEIEVVLDEPPSRGPLSGLAAALKQIKTTHLLALAIDLPRMNPAHLETIWSHARRGGGAIPQDGNHFEPLAAVYPAEAADVAEDALAGDDVSLHKFIRTLAGRMEIHFHPVSNAEAVNYRNVNTPEEIARISTRSVGNFCA